jgi:predicted nucleotidyltransferase
MADPDPRPERRQVIVSEIVSALAAAIPGSQVNLRGSLAAGTADRYSDIDLCWVVTNESFRTAVESVKRALGGDGPVTSLRVDPSFALSDHRRLLFIRLEGMPLFWRVDLEIRARSVADDESYDTDNPAARSEEGWSRPASAIENAVAAVKAVLRHQPDAANGLLQRGYERIGLRFDAALPPARAIRGLADACVARQPSLGDIAKELHELVDRLI